MTIRALSTVKGTILTMIKTLPMAQPLINYIPWTNNVSAIINTNFEKYGNCLFKKFIQMADHGNHRFMFDEYNLTLDIYDCFLPFSIPMFLFNSKQELEDQLIDLLDKGYYVYTNVQTYYIAPYSNYKQDYRFHDMLIFGVNMEERTFKCADFFRDNYAYETCKMDEVIEAISDHSTSEHGGGMPYFNNIVCFKLIDTYGDQYYSDNANKILTSLYSMLGKNLTVNQNGNEIYPRFGLSVFDGVISRLTDHPYEEDTFLDGYYLFKMNFHFFEEHIKHMKNRILYLCGEDNKNQSGNVAICESLCDIMFKCRNVVIKYAMKQSNLSDKSKHDLADKLSMVKNQYAQVISSLINYLESL
jgi:hypothetical protein